MSRRFPIFVSVAAILLMAVPQLYQVLDRWDTVADIGRDTECMLLVVGICIGLCLLSALLIVQLTGWLVAVFMRLLPATLSAAQSQNKGTAYLRLLFSPPLSATSLRI